MAGICKACVPMEEQIPGANYGHLELLSPKQDVIPIDIVPDHFPKQHIASQMPKPYLDIYI